MIGGLGIGSTVICNNTRRFILRASFICEFITKNLFGVVQASKSCLA
jgi:hypothetical protein